MSFLVRCGSCVFLAAIAIVPVHAQYGGWCVPYSAGYWGAGYAPYAPPTPLFSASTVSWASPAGCGAPDACCVPSSCSPCGSACGNGCSQGSCGGCEPGAGSLKPNADENFGKKAPGKDGRSDDTSDGLDPDFPGTEPDDPDFKSPPRRNPPGRMPKDSESGSGASEDLPGGRSGRRGLNSEEPDTLETPRPRRSRSQTGGDGLSDDLPGGLFEEEPLMKTKRPPIGEPDTEEGSAGKSGATSTKPTVTDPFKPPAPGPKSKEADEADNEFPPIDMPDGTEKEDPSTEAGAFLSPRGRRSESVASQLREVIPFTRLALPGQDSPRRAPAETAGGRPVLRWISVPMKAGHARL